MNKFTGALVLSQALFWSYPQISYGQEVADAAPVDQSVLAAFVENVWSRHPKIEEAQARAEAAQARQKAASRWRYNPEFEYEMEDKEGAPETQLFGVGQEIDWSGKSRASGKVAQYQYRAVEAMGDRTRQEVTLDLLTALVEYQAASEIASLFGERALLMTRFSDIATQGFQAGDIDEGELNLARLALSETLILQAEADAELAADQRALDLAAGYPVAGMLRSPIMPSRFPKIVVEMDQLDALITKLPDIRILRNELDASQAEIKRARLDQLPDPRVSVRGGQDEGDDFLGVSVSIPINVFNTYQAEVNAAKHDAVAADRVYYNAIYAAKPSLLASKRRYDVTLKAWQAWQRDGNPALSKQIKTLNLKYSAGDLNATDYLVQIEQALDIEVTAAELRQKTWQAWFDWLAASGRATQWVQALGEQR